MGAFKGGLRGWGLEGRASRGGFKGASRGASRRHSVGAPRGWLDCSRDTRLRLRVLSNLRTL